MTLLTSRLPVILSNPQYPKPPLRVRVPRLSKNSVLRVKAATEVSGVVDTLVPADIANFISAAPLREASQFLLEHPIASFTLSVAALLIVPKLIEVRAN